jgi:uncharacterized protein YicC (UPF0701 family)
MTGFGRGVAEAGGRRVTVEIRAVNHRFLDLKVRGEPLGPAHEELVAARVRAAIARGAVTVVVHVGREVGAAAARIDAAAARRAHAALTELARELGLPDPDLALVLAQPGVVIAPGTASEADAAELDDEPLAGAPDAPGPRAPRPAGPLGAALDAALGAALAQLAQMRTAEGGALASELRARLAELEVLRARIAERAADVPAQAARRLAERVRRLIADAGLAGDPALGGGRLAPAADPPLHFELAQLADRADVTEELVRLASHLEQARALLAAPGAIGRRLDFLAQEIGRELTTIGSKSIAAEISAAVVEAKAALEKAREQLQNLE